MRISYDYYLVQ